MSDIDRVFARLGGGQPTGSSQRELRTVPRRGGSTGSRVVEVVRLPARGATSAGSDARQNGPGVHAQTWGDGFPARSVASPAPEPVEADTKEAVTHVMPMWTPTAAEPDVEPVMAVPPDAERVADPPAKRVGGGARETSRRVADPFDAQDDEANCLRCGYAIGLVRERRGLATCADCG